MGIETREILISGIIDEKIAAKEVAVNVVFSPVLALNILVGTDLSDPELRVDWGIPWVLREW